jgi:hypothetical protein
MHCSLERTSFYKFSAGSLPAQLHLHHCYSASFDYFFPTDKYSILCSKHLLECCQVVVGPVPQRLLLRLGMRITAAAATFLPFLANA